MNRNLVAYRNLINIKQKTMANKLSISLSSYSQKETGRKQFNQKEMMLITELFKKDIPDITMDDIFFDKKVPFSVSKTN